MALLNKIKVFEKTLQTYRFCGLLDKYGYIPMVALTRQGKALAKLWETFHIEGFCVLFG